MRVIAPVLVGLALAPASLAQQQQPTVDPSIADGSAQKALNQAKRKWLHHGPHSYTYRVQLSCFCTQDSLKPHTFVVRNRRPVHPPKGHKGEATAWRLFKIVQGAIDDRADGLHVEYRANGSLKMVSVDRYSMAIDDEYTFFVDRFKRLR